MFHRARRRVDHRGRDIDPAPLLQHDAMHTDRIGHAQQRADVLRVFQQIQDQQKRRFVPAGSRLQDGVQIDVRIIPSAQRHALMIGVFREIVNHAARHTAHIHAALLRRRLNRLDHAFFVDTFSQQKLLKVAPPGAQAFQNRPAPVQIFSHSLFVFLTGQGADRRAPQDCPYDQSLVLIHAPDRTIGAIF